MTSVYVHIPFCRSRCAYCDFLSSTLGSGWQRAYLSALHGEMLRRRFENGEPLASSVYIGGGTPSVLSPSALCRLIYMICENFTLSPQAEFTLELNPDDVSPALLSSLRGTPVNRLSMGVQTLSPALLRFLRRRHTAEQAMRAVGLLQDAGYTNLSVDLIYGIPGQTVEMFSSDVRAVLATGIPHLSAYALQIEPGTPLWQMLGSGQISEADEEVSLASYTSLRSLTRAAGMGHYEISNFALPGHHSRHNSGYWRGTPYLGFGAGAHSYDGRNVRRANAFSVQQYVAGQGEPQIERLTPSELYDERVMLSLRTSSGLSLPSIREEFGEGMLHHLVAAARPHLASGMLQLTGDTLRLSPSALFISNSVITDLLAQ